MRFLSALVLALLPACSLIDAATGDEIGGGLTFSRSNIPNTGAQPKAVAIAELDGGGGSDIVVIDESNTIIICFQVGDGTSAEFSCNRTTFTGYTLLAADDLDGDGTSELLAASTTTIDIYRNSGGQSFMLVSSLPLGGEMARKIVAGSLNLPEGNRSVAVSTMTNQVLVFSDVLNDPVMTHHVTAIDAAPSAEPRGIAIGDTDPTIGGGELVIADGMNIVEYTGGSSLTRGKSISAGPGSGARSLVIGHFGGGRSHADIAFYHPNMQDSDLGIVPGSPSGLGEVDVRFGRTSTGLELFTGDLDDDEDDDVVLLSEPSQGSRLRLFVQISDGVFDDGTDVSLQRTPLAVAVGDLDLDNELDFAIVPGSGGGVDLLVSD